MYVIGKVVYYCGDSRQTDTEASLDSGRVQGYWSVIRDIAGAYFILYYLPMPQPKFKKFSLKQQYVPAKGNSGKILDLVYWRDPKKSSAALLLSLTVITIFARYSVLSVISYAGLAVLAGTLGYRLFKTVEGHIKKTNGDNPFHEYLAQDWSLPQERVHAQVDVLVEHGIKIANQLKRLVFIENIVDSTKFGLLLWSVTYIASWFSGYALAILFVLGMFTIPKVYETYEEPIDAHFATINDHVKNVLHLIETKLPFLRKTQVETEKKDQ